MSKFFSYEGRINRLPFFVANVLMALLSGILSQIAKGENSMILIIGFIVSILLCAKSIMITIQRFHDLDRPGTHIWLFLIPIYNIYLDFVLLFKTGTSGPNQYGNDPLKDL